MVNTHTHIVNTRLHILPWWISLQDAESMYDEVDEVKIFAIHRDTFVQDSKLLKTYILEI